MKPYALVTALSIFLTSTLAAPHNPLPLAPREPQRDRTYTITCLGPQCTDYPPTTLSLPTGISIPGGVPNPPRTTSTSSPVRQSSTTRGGQAPTRTAAGGGQGTGPSHTACPMPLYYQCGGYFDGVPWKGCTRCVGGAKCVVQNDWYSQCVAE